VIARLEGRLAEKRPEAVLLDVGGVGYEVRVPLSTFVELPDEGKTVRLRVHTYVREDALHLYGFLTEAERTAFSLLLGISGVGPKLALAVLSGLAVGRLVAAVQRGDLASLRGIPGVGAKTAERILIELRDKTSRLQVEAPGRTAADLGEAAASALANLGYPRAQAERAVGGALSVLGEGARLEDLIREALRVAAG
jgi:Holliday junction DNA helicase RuvA